jgi:hypothetical protein
MSEGPDPGSGYCLWFLGCREVQGETVPFHQEVTVSLRPPDSTAAVPAAPVDRAMRPLRTPLLLGGPVLFFVGYTLHPHLPEAADAALAEVATGRGLYLGAKLVVALGGLLMVAVVWAIRERFSVGRGRVLLTIGATLTAVGMTANAISQAVWGYLLWFLTAPTVEPADGAEIVGAAQATAVEESLATLPISFVSVPLFAVGLLLLAVGLWRSRAVPRWVPITIVVTTVLAGAFGVGLPMLAVGAAATVAFAVALRATPSRGV